MLKHLLYLTLKPQDVRLALLDGRIVAIVDNYIEVFQVKPTITDGVTQVLHVEVPDDEVTAQQDGESQRLILWKGDPSSRSRPQDKLTLPVSSLITLGGEGPSQIALANQAFGGLPDEIKLAITIVNVQSDTLIAAGVSDPIAAKQMAEAVLTKNARA